MSTTTYSVCHGDLENEELTDASWAEVVEYLEGLPEEDCDPVYVTPSGSGVTKIATMSHPLFDSEAPRWGLEDVEDEKPE